MITLEDIARQAGVSHSTVSRALADSPLVHPDTKKRIQDLAREAGYQVNQVARNLRFQSTRTIGLVVPEVSNPYYPKLIQQVADLARESGYSLQLHLSGADQAAENTCLASLREQRVDGILLVTAERGRWVEDAEHIDMVMGDDAKGGYALAQHLIGLGHRSIAILGKPSHRGGYDRLFGFKTALEEAGLVLSEEMQLVANSDAEVKSGVIQLIGLTAPPTAIFAYQDSLAALVIGHLADMCIPIPQAMTVVGFDNLDLATYICPHLTTVGGHIEPLAAQFVNLLIARIRKTHPNTSPQRVVITPQLVVRGSCAPPRRESSITKKTSSPEGYYQQLPTRNTQETSR
ncbi:MAG: LacI family DNA-binding transcriptional regulator [Armatimonadetes bacterium]|nr:LacI family DNA-binding transcriptional regulator [Armatimonadota bacterium]